MYKLTQGGWWGRSKAGELEGYSADSSLSLKAREPGVPRPGEDPGSQAERANPFCPGLFVLFGTPQTG